MIRWLLKWILRLAALVVVLVILLLAFKDSIFRSMAEQRIRRETGMDARIGRFSSSLFSPVVTIENLKLYNTAEFGGTLFLDLPELHVEVDPVSFAQNKLRITLARLNIAELDIVRNEAGQTNIVSLLSRMEAPAGHGKNGRKEKWMGDVEFVGIDMLNLSVGKVKYIDLKDASGNRDLPLNLQNQILKNIKSEGDLYGNLIVMWWNNSEKFPVSLKNLIAHLLGGHAAPPQQRITEVIEKPAKSPPK